MDHSAATSSATRRRTSAALPSKLSLYVPANGTSTAAPPPPPPPLDLELLSIKSSLAYTSLKDVLPTGSAVNSPTAGASTPNGGYEICIRNRLVKQAAWAYLQPMSASPSYSGTDYFHRLRCQFSGSHPFAACLGLVDRYIVPAVTWVFDRLLRAIGIRINR